MSSMLLYPEKRILTNGIMSGNPSKKMKLDFPNDGSVINEDLWGQDDLTAEEFDMLEIQATQAQNQNHLSSVSCAQSSLEEVEDCKHLQYELEGRIKVLSHSLEKVLKDLGEERSNRQKIINDKIKEFSEKENTLKKEVEKIQSILEFKEQEMKSMYNKLHLLKSQVEKKSADTTNNKHFEDFLKSSFHTGESSPKLSCNKFFRRNKLSVDTPRGEAEGMDILSSVLCTRFAIPLPSSSENSINDLITGSTTIFTPFAVMQLKDEQKSDELLGYYVCVLKSSISHLKNQSSKDTASNSMKTSPLSVRQIETNILRPLISCLRDLNCLLSCPKYANISSECNNSSKSCFNENNGQVSRIETSVPSNDLIHSKKIENTFAVCQSPMLEFLLELSNPNIYPTEYPKSEAVELSLSALLTISVLCPEKFVACISDYSVCSLISSHQSISSLCAALKLLTNLSVCKGFVSHLIHKNDHCLLCSVATLCSTIFSNHETFAFCMTLIEDFLSSSLTAHLSEIQFQSSQCISEVIRHLITLLLKYLQIKEDSSFHTVIMKKGFILLHFMSGSVSDFKEKRSLVEDEYISLVSGLLTLSKENLEFREFYDLLHNLWDFQSDINEFDLDEPSEETQTSNSDTDVTD